MRPRATKMKYHRDAPVLVDVVSLRVSRSLPIYAEMPEGVAFDATDPVVATLSSGEQPKVLRVRYLKDAMVVEVKTANGRSGWVMYDGDAFSLSMCRRRSRATSSRHIATRTRATAVTTAVSVITKYFIDSIPTREITPRGSGAPSTRRAKAYRERIEGGGRWVGAELCSRPWDLEVPADLLHEVVEDLPMTRNRCDLLCLSVYVDRVISTFAKELAAVRFEVLDQIAPFQAETLIGSRMTSASWISSSASSRLAASTMLIASARFARASSNVAPCVFAPGSSSAKAMYPPSTARNTAVKFTSITFLVSILALSRANRPRKGTNLGTSALRLRSAAAVSYAARALKPCGNRPVREAHADVRGRKATGRPNNENHAGCPHRDRPCWLPIHVALGNRTSG